MIQGLLGVAAIAAGGTKLIGADMHVENFDRFSYPQWFRLVVGAVETLPESDLSLRSSRRYVCLCRVNQSPTLHSFPWYIHHRHHESPDMQALDSVSILICVHCGAVSVVPRIYIRYYESLS